MMIFTKFSLLEQNIKKKFASPKTFFLATLLYIEINIFVDLKQQTEQNTKCKLVIFKAIIYNLIEFVTPCGTNKKFCFL